MRMNAGWSALLAGCLLALATCDHKSPARPREDGSLERQPGEEIFARQSERSPDGVRRYLEKLGVIGHYAGEDTARIGETTAGIEDHHADRAPASRAVAAAPVADAGADQVVAVGSWVILDGRGSRSADGSPLGYRWSAPEGVALNSTAVRPSFFAASAGTYRFTLVVNDGQVDSAPVEVAITVVPPDTGGIQVIGEIEEDKGDIQVIGEVEEDKGDIRVTGEVE